jgi:hypothetical protein
MKSFNCQQDAFLLLHSQVGFHLVQFVQTVHYFRVPRCHKWVVINLQLFVMILFTILSFFFLRKIICLFDHSVVCVSFIPSFFNIWIIFYKIWYEHSAIEGHLKLRCSDFLQSVITTWQTHKLVMWEQQ